VQVSVEAHDIHYFERTRTSPGTSDFSVGAGQR
jgi:hypothetical protein